MNIEKTQDKIRELISEVAHVEDIAKRTEIQETISGYMVYLAEEEDKANRAFKSAYTKRKIDESHSIYESEESVSKATASAAYLCREERQAETKLEVEYECLKIFRMVVFEHLDVMKQRTAALRKEKSVNEYKSN